MTTKRPWLMTDLKTLREIYPAHGVKACVQALPGRTERAIHQQARKHGLRAPGQPETRQSYPPNEHLDNQIRRLYGSALQRGAIAEFAKRHRRPKWWVSKRAAELGVVKPISDRNWSPPELDLLARTAHLTPIAASQQFKKAGHSRTVSAIASARKRAGLYQTEARLEAGVYTAHQVSELLGLDNTTVIRWINLKLIKATREAPATGEDITKVPYQI